MASLSAMATDRQPAVYLITGAAGGALIRYAVYEIWPGPIAVLVSTAVVITASAWAVGLILGLGKGRAQAFGLGVAGGAASLSTYAVLGVTGKALPGALFLKIGRAHV